MAEFGPLEFCPPLAGLAQKWCTAFIQMRPTGDEFAFFAHASASEFSEAKLATCLDPSLTLVLPEALLRRS
jgi:hypothetical protein